MVVVSDKADMDVEAFDDGYLAAILKEDGETVDVGAPVGIIVPNESDISKFSADAGLFSSLSTSSDTASSSSSSKTVLDALYLTLRFK